MSLFGAAFAAPNKGTTILYWFGSLSTVFILTENRIQGFFRAFEWFSSTFQGIFNFQGLFKKALYIQVLFKTVQTLHIMVICTQNKIHEIWSIAYLVMVEDGINFVSVDKTLDRLTDRRTNILRSQKLILCLWFSWAKTSERKFCYLKFSSSLNMFWEAFLFCALVEPSILK